MSTNTTQRNTKPLPACRRAPVTQTVAERREAHRQKMMVRRQFRSRPPGFTPVPNRRISKAIEAAQALIMLAAAERGSPMNPVDAQGYAIREVARTLPPPRKAFDWRNGMPTKNNNPEYRK